MPKPTDEQKTVIRERMGWYTQHCDDVWNDMIFELEMQLDVDTDVLEDWLDDVG